MECKHFYGRSVKSEEGIPYDYEHGCMAGYDCIKCGMQCEGYEPIGIMADIEMNLKALRERDANVGEIRMPKDLYERLTPEQIAWAEKTWAVKIIPVVHRQSEDMEWQKYIQSSAAMTSYMIPGARSLPSNKTPKILAKDYAKKKKAKRRQQKQSRRR